MLICENCDGEIYDHQEREQVANPDGGAGFLWVHAYEYDCEEEEDSEDEL